MAENIKKTLIMLGMMSFLSFKMGLHMPVGIQAAMLPLELFTSPLVFKYLFGSKSESPYGEKLEPYVRCDDACLSTTALTGSCHILGRRTTTMPPRLPLLVRLALARLALVQRTPLRMLRPAPKVPRQPPSCWTSSWIAGTRRGHSRSSSWTSSCRRVRTSTHRRPLSQWRYVQAACAHWFVRPTLTSMCNCRTTRINWSAE